MLASKKIWAIDLAPTQFRSDSWGGMPLNEELSAVDEEGGVEDDEGVSD